MTWLVIGSTAAVRVFHGFHNLLISDSLSPALSHWRNARARPQTLCQGRPVDRAERVTQTVKAKARFDQTEVLEALSQLAQQGLKTLPPVWLSPRCWSGSARLAEVHCSIHRASGLGRAQDDLSCSGARRGSRHPSSTTSPRRRRRHAFGHRCARDPIDLQDRVPIRGVADVGQLKTISGLEPDRSSLPRSGRPTIGSSPTGAMVSRVM